MAPRYQAPRGTRDILPGEIERWQWAEARARGVLQRYGYREIRTPLMEDYELFARTSGESSDVVQKEMYRFKDQGDRDLALRPEGTAGVCRAYLQHGLAAQGRIHSLWYLGPMFRYGRPQKGRWRQFWQIGAEVIGTAAPGADVEVIALFVDVFAAWGLENLSVAVNSVGTPASRRVYADRLREWLAPATERLSADSRQRLLQNPLRVLDSKDPEDRAILANDHGGRGPMPRMLDAVEPADRAHFDAVLAGLRALGIPHEVDHGLVRGLDYYTRTAFEVHDRSLGAQSTLGGGGRYDGLIEELGGPPTPGVGFSIGLDRTLLILEERGAAASRREPAIYLAATETTRALVPELARRLRRRFAVKYDLEERALSAQMKAADKSGAAWLVLLGEEEWKRGELLIKDLGSGQQLTVPASQLESALAERLSGRVEMAAEPSRGSPERGR
jgi:histidyl-tRNA synthetase